MKARELEQALRAHGVVAEVVPDGALAVLRIAGDASGLADAATRRTLVSLAAAHGFRNVALEVTD